MIFDNKSTNILGITDYQSLVIEVTTRNEELKNNMICSIKQKDDEQTTNNRLHDLRYRDYDREPKSKGKKYKGVVKNVISYPSQSNYRGNKFVIVASFESLKWTKNNFKIESIKFEEISINF